MTAYEIKLPHDDKFKRRLGKVKYTGMFVDQGAAALYRCFVPLHLEYNVQEDVYLATGLADQFRVLELGERVPSYKAVITKVPNGYSDSYYVTFKEVIEDAALDR